MKQVFAILLLFVLAGCDLSPGIGKNRLITEVLYCQAAGLDAEFVSDNQWRGVDVVRCVEPGDVLTHSESKL